MRTAIRTEFDESVRTEWRLLRAQTTATVLRALAGVIVVLAAIGALVAVAGGIAAGEWAAGLGVALGAGLYCAMVAAVLAGLGCVVEMQSETFREVRELRWRSED